MSSGALLDLVSSVHSSLSSLEMEKFRSWSLDLLREVTGQEKLLEKRDCAAFEKALRELLAAAVKLRAPSASDRFLDFVHGRRPQRQLELAVRGVCEAAKALDLKDGLWIEEELEMDGAEGGGGLGEQLAQVFTQPVMKLGSFLLVSPSERERPLRSAEMQVGCIDRLRKENEIDEEEKTQLIAEVLRAVSPQNVSEEQLESNEPPPSLAKSEWMGPPIIHRRGHFYVKMTGEVTKQFRPSVQEVVPVFKFLCAWESGPGSKPFYIHWYVLRPFDDVQRLHEELSTNKELLFKSRWLQPLPEKRGQSVRKKRLSKSKKVILAVGKIPVGSKTTKEKREKQFSTELRNWFVSTLGDLKDPSGRNENPSHSVFESGFDHFFEASVKVLEHQNY